MLCVNTQIIPNFVAKLYEVLYLGMNDEDIDLGVPFALGDFVQMLRPNIRLSSLERMCTGALLSISVFL